MRRNWSEEAPIYYAKKLIWGDPHIVSEETDQMEAPI